ncbi:hypothetical protein FOCC_FOCC004711 [Frankliniella occidentalis]|nr:hypothetical protein FOCC_FOCC004711 [Frankliniella occidentalis]
MVSFSFVLGIILYTFIQFHSTPAIVTSVLIGIGIIFCGCAMVHNVFVWQKEKTNAVRQLGRQQQEQHRQNLQHHSQQLNSTHWMNDISKHTGNGSLIPGVPPATLDLSSVTTTPHELSTLV